MNAAANGDSALASSDIPTAIKCFTQALVELPRAPSYYIKRSTAYSRLKATDGGPNSAAALRDAEIALHLARERGKRELILQAQMRRGISLYQLERYGDAAFLFEKIKEKIDGDGQGTSSGKDAGNKYADVQNAMAQHTPKRGFEQELPIWSLKVKAKLSKLESGDEKAAVTVTEFPSSVQAPTEKELKLQLEALESGKKGEEAFIEQKEKEQEAASQMSGDKRTETATRLNLSAPPTGQGASVQITIRHEWYQNFDTVVITLYAKGVPKDAVGIDLKDDSVSLQFPLAGGADFAFTLDPLFAQIDPSASKVSVLSTKIEVTLRKRVAGQKWNALEAPAAGLTGTNGGLKQGSFTTTVATAQVSTGPTSTSGPAYPTSSRHGVKDWDKLAAKLTTKDKSQKKGKSSSKEEGDANESGGDESDSGESIDSEYGGDAVDAFFKKLYANADSDTRRAMMKSYIESQGTALSTNWAEVGKGKVEVRPPSDD